MRIENLDANIQLEELYLSHNGLENIENLDSTEGLIILDLSNNKIKELNNLSHLSSLSELWMNDNQIDNFEELKKIESLKEVETVYLERNPLYSDKMYRKKIQLYLPSIKQIDATYVRLV